MPRYELNYEKKLIEIYFEKKPSEAIRDTMKANGWRWSGFKKSWYNYYSDSNLRFAESLCGSNKNGFYDEFETKQTKTPKKVTQPTTKIISSFECKSYLSKGDRVMATDELGTKYVGTVDDIYQSLEEVGVNYITESGVTRWKRFKLSNVKKQASVLSTSLYEGRIVSFLTDEGVRKKGKIIYVNLDDSYNITYYDVSDMGEISSKNDTYVCLERILEIEYGANIFPVRVGDKVEFESEKGGFTTGKITCINDDDSVDIEYEYIDSWGDKESSEDYYVSLNDIKVMVRGRKALDKSLYITQEKQKSIDINEKIKKRIKSRGDNFLDASHLVQNRVLYRHQKAGTMLADMYDKFAFFYDTGTGKTVMALDIVMSKQKKDNARFLIIAPKSIIKTAWMDDAAKYYPGLRILPLYNGFNAKKKRELFHLWRTGGKAARWESDPIFYAHIRLIGDMFNLGTIKIDSDVAIDEILAQEACHYIVNSEMFIRNPEKYIKDLNITGIIMDESAILKNYNGKTAKIMREMTEQVKYLYLLSGKPAPNNIIEYFSQMKIVDPDTFSMSYDRFLNMFCYSTNRKYNMLPENKELFAEMISVRSLIISKKDCLDLPKTVDVVRQIEIPGEIMSDYNELYRECMTLIKGMDNSNIFYSTQSRLAILMKLRQMASGFFMTGSGNSRESKMIIDIHDAKIEELNNVIDQIEEEQVIVWCQFQHEIELVEQELSKRAYTVTAYGKTRDLEKNIDDFKTGRAQYIVAHPKTLKYGVTFVNCKYTIYYSFSYSAEDYDQSHDRNYRLGQTEMCTYIYIQAADTIDEIMYDKVMNKLSNAEFFERLIKDAAKHGIDYDSLKQKDDDAIQKALSEDGGEISTITRNISTKVYKKTKEESYSSNKVFTTYDYLDKIEEPTYFELREIERSFAVRPKEFRYYYVTEMKRFFAECGPFSNELFDATRPDYFDFVHAYEVYEEFSKDMSENEFHLFLKEQPEEDHWVYEMYRDVYHAMLAMSDSAAEVITEKYGLEDGKQRSIKTITEKFREKYYTGYDYIWNTARVTNELRGGLSFLKWRFDYEKYAEKIKELFIR